LGWRPSGSDGPGNVETPTLDVRLHSDDPAAEMLVFFAVDDLDVSLERLSQLGDTQHGDLRADPELGRFAVCSDNQGVRFVLQQHVQ